MAFLVSPGVQVREFDLTTVVPAVATTEGVIGGVFHWGPLEQRILIDSETQLVKRFGKPSNLNAETWLTAASFLGYGNRLYVSRAANTEGLSPKATVNTTANSATVKLEANTTTGLGITAGMTVISAVGGGIVIGGVVSSVINSTAFSMTSASDVTANTTGNQIQLVTNTAFSAIGTVNTSIVENLAGQIAKNEVDFNEKLEEASFDDNVVFLAKYPGEMGNSLRISVCANTDGYSSSIDLSSNAVLANSESADVSVTFSTGSNTAIVRFVGDSNTAVDAAVELLTPLLNTYDKLEAGNTKIGMQYLTIDSVGSANTCGTTIYTNHLIAQRSNTTILVANSSGDIDEATANTDDLAAGMVVSVGNTYLIGLTVASVVNSTAFTVTTAPTANVAYEEHDIYPASYINISLEDRYVLSSDIVYSSNGTNTNLVRKWQYFNVADEAPGQSDYVLNFGNSAVTSDEMHVVVVDEGGKFTGVPGTVLEVYRGVSRATDAKTVDGAANYWKTVINDASQYVYAVNDIQTDGGIAASATAANLTDSTLDVVSYRLALGKDGKDESNIELALVMGAYDLYKSAEDVDISLLIQGKARSYQLANYLIDNIAETRKDCIVLVSPEKGHVVNNIGNEADAIVAFRNNVRSTSYAVMDSGYKYMYDRYNDVYRWIPLNGDTAGLCVRTDYTNDPWWSPAGFNRGQIKNLVKLAFNPRQSERDTLYKAGVNPVVTFPGQGTILYGDKTLLAKPSAFDRINVRRLFIVLEKAIATASKFTLFEFNDEFTRSQFKNLVVPYLRDVQGRRGITDFLVVCDATNNTPEVIDRNEFVGDIYIKPARSINFIQLNFVAVRTGVAFSEVVGKF